MVWYRRDGSGQGSREKGEVGSPTLVERKTNQTVRRRASAISRWSAVSGIDRRRCRGSQPNQMEGMAAILEPVGHIARR